MTEKEQGGVLKCKFRYTAFFVAEVQRLLLKCSVFRLFLLPLHNEIAIGNKVDYKNLITRTVSGAVLVGVVVGSILWKEKSFFVLFSVISALSICEFHKLTTANVNRGKNGAVGCVLLFAAAYSSCSSIVSYGCIKWFWVVYGLWLLCTLIAELWLKRPDPIASWANMALGQIYVAVPFALLNSIAFYQGEYRPLPVLSLFILIWVNDTFAYLSGSMLGRHRMFERISPKKSWEGFVGGNLFALAAGYVMSIFEPGLTWWQWLVFAEVVVVFGTLGDLMESLMKRTLNVKDSGHSIPGHGGWLDRFDSLLLATPALAIYLCILA